MSTCPVCGATGKPVLADWCSGAGGAGWGYQLAGFHTVGHDLLPQPRYPGCFIQGDVLAAATAGFDAFHASPPCTDHRKNATRLHGTGWLLDACRQAMAATGRPWVLENVPWAPMRADYRLCGCMYNLGNDTRLLRRERWFETSWGAYSLRAPCYHDRPAITVLRHGARIETPRPRVTGHQKYVPQVEAARLMGIHWMSERELGDAIPPAYTADIGADLMAHLIEQAAS